MLVIAGGILIAFAVMGMLRHLGKVLLVLALLALLGAIVGPG